MKQNIFLCAFIFSHLLNYGQTNLIQNGSFESGNRIYPMLYTYPSHIYNNSQSLNGCDFWSVATPNPDDCGGTTGLGSCPTADWFDGAYYPSPETMVGSPPLLNTNKCAGLLLTSLGSPPAWVEGVRQTLKSNLIGGRFYKLKLRMAIGHISSNTFYTNVGKDCGVIVGFSKFSTNYDASPTWSANVVWRDAIKFSIPANSQHEWYEFTEYFRVPYEVDGGGGG